MILEITRFKILTVVVLQGPVYWDVTPCHYVTCALCFRGMQCRQRTHNPRNYRNYSTKGSATYHKTCFFYAASC